MIEADEEYYEELLLSQAAEPEAIDTGKRPLEDSTAPTYSKYLKF